MKNSENLLKRIISLISYKEGAPQKEFYIPEVSEDQSAEKGKKAAEKDKKSTEREKDKKNPQRYKMPIPLVQNKKKNKKVTPLMADDRTISNSAESNAEYLKSKFNIPINKDFVIRYLSLGGKHKGFISYMRGISDKNAINDFILRPILSFRQQEAGNQEESLLDSIFESVIETNQASKITSPDAAVFEILAGNTLVYFEPDNYYISCETVGNIGRSVEKPQAEGTVIGSQEAFNESLLTNISLVRRLVKSSKLTSEIFKLGSETRINCSIMYMKGLVNPAIVDEVKRRIKGIKTDYVTGSGFIEQFIEDSTTSLLPTIISTERPDKVAANIIEGRVSILVEGVPFAQIVPVTITAFLESAEDNLLRWQYSTFSKLIRFLALFMASLLPGLYIAITNFHQEMIPTDLLIAIAEAKEKVPFPSLIEVLLMEISFELIREAGIRVPGIIGNTLGIIGALILGQAAVQANIVNPVLIIIVSVTGLSNFAIPNYSFAFGIRIIRFLFILAGASLGLYGITVMFSILAVWIANMNSFGVPYLSPMFPKTEGGNEFIVRKPAWKQSLRPEYLNAQVQRRQPYHSRQWKSYGSEKKYYRGSEDDK